MSPDKAILYVENTRDDLDIFHKFAKRAGFEIEIAETVDKAVELLSNKKFLAIILDIMVPAEKIKLKPIDREVPKYMGGIIVFEMVLEDKFSNTGNDKNTPIVVVSAVALASVRKKIKSLLGKYTEQRYLTKPVTPRDIIDSLKNALAE